MKQEKGTGIDSKTQCGEYCQLPFLEAQYPNEWYIFWPDPVRAHRAERFQCFKREGIPCFFFKERVKSLQIPIKSGP